MTESLGGPGASFETLPKTWEGPLLALGALVLSLVLLGPSLQTWDQLGAFVAIALAGANACLGLAASRQRGAALALLASLVAAGASRALPANPVAPLICLIPAAWWFYEDKVLRPGREEDEAQRRLEALRSGGQELWLESLTALSPERLAAGLEALLSNPAASGAALDQVSHELPKSLRCLLSAARLSSCADPEQRRSLIQSALESIDESPAPEELALSLLESVKSAEERRLLSPRVGVTKSVAANLIFALRYAKAEGLSSEEALETASRLAEIAVTSLMACDREIELGHLLDSAEELWSLCDAKERELLAVEVLKMDPSPSLILALGPQLRLDHEELLQSLSERDEPENLSALATILVEPALEGLRAGIARAVIDRVRASHPPGENAIADEICAAFEIHDVNS